MLSPGGLSGQIGLRKSVNIGGHNQYHWRYCPGREKSLHVVDQVGVPTEFGKNSTLRECKQEPPKFPPHQAELESMIVRSGKRHTTDQPTCKYTPHLIFGITEVIEFAMPQY